MFVLREKAVRKSVELERLVNDPGILVLLAEMRLQKHGLVQKKFAQILPRRLGCVLSILKEKYANIERSGSSKLPSAQSQRADWTIGYPGIS